MSCWAPAACRCGPSSDTDIEIASIATLEKKKFSSLKTGLLVGLLAVGLLDSDCEGDPCGEYGGGPYCCG